MNISDDKLRAVIELAVISKMWEEVPRRPRTVPYLRHPERPVTENLRLNALKVEQISDGVFRVFIDDSIAPYMPYTNEEWTADHWNGAQNPNFHWWQEFCEVLIKDITLRLNQSTRRLRSVWEDD